MLKILVLSAFPIFPIKTPYFREGLPGLPGYNTGARTNRKIMYDAYAYYAAQYEFIVAAGVHYPPEPWGPFYTYTHQHVADLSNHILEHPERKEEKTVS